MPSTDPHSSDLYQLLVLARDTSALWQARNAKASSAQATTQAERGVLEMLVRDGAQSVPAIARARLVSRQHIQTLVDALAKKRLAEFQPNPAHKTSPLVDVTIEGERAYTAAASHEAEILGAIATNLESTKLDPALDALRALTEALRSTQ